MPCGKSLVEIVVGAVVVNGTCDTLRTAWAAQSSTHLARGVLGYASMDRTTTSLMVRRMADCSSSNHFSTLPLLLQSRVRVERGGVVHEVEVQVGVSEGGWGCGGGGGTTTTMTHGTQSTKPHHPSPPTGMLSSPAHDDAQQSHT